MFQNTVACCYICEIYPLHEGTFLTDIYTPLLQPKLLQINLKIPGTLYTTERIRIVLKLLHGGTKDLLSFYFMVHQLRFEMSSSDYGTSINTRSFCCKIRRIYVLFIARCLLRLTCYLQNLYK